MKHPIYKEDINNFFGYVLLVALLILASFGIWLIISWFIPDNLDNTNCETEAIWTCNTNCEHEDIWIW